MKQEAFVELITQNQGIIHKVCNLYCNNGEEREDLYQEIVLQSWKSIGSFKGEAKFTTWLYRVALNTAISALRKEKRKPSTERIYGADDRSIEIADSSAEDAEKRAQIDQLFQAIGKLSKVDKALVMLYIDDLRYEEIGEILGISTNYVAVKMNRIKSKLKNMMTAA